MLTYTSQNATTTSLVNSIAGDLSITIAQTIGVVLSIAVFLVAVGFAWRKLKQKAVGKGF